MVRVGSLLVGSFQLFLLLAAHFTVLLLATGPNIDTVFKEWFLENGGSFNSIDIETFADMGRGFVAAKDVSSEQEIIKIPSLLIFSVSNLRSLKADPVLALIHDVFDPDNAIAAWLLLEKMRGEASFFKPYLDVLPSYVPSLIHFSVKDLRELQNPKLEGEARQMQMQTRNDYDEFISNAQNFWPFPLEDSHNSFELYKWAVTIINSRGLRFHGIVYLSPMADLFNYAPHSETRKAASGEFFTNHHKLAATADGGITILADRDVPKGSQVFEDYGDNNDDLYLKYHGFVANNNPFTCVNLETAEFVEIKTR